MSKNAVSKVKAAAAITQDVPPQCVLTILAELSVPFDLFALRNYLLYPSANSYFTARVQQSQICSELFYSFRLDTDCLYGGINAPLIGYFLQPLS